MTTRATTSPHHPVCQRFCQNSHWGVTVCRPSWRTSGGVHRVGWALMSPGKDRDTSLELLSVSATADYDNLCVLDVLGLADATGEGGNVYSEFKEQLRRSADGWYETSLPWKGNHRPLPTNWEGSIRRMTSLVRKFKRTNMLDQYNIVIRDQISQVVVEEAPEEVSGREFYIPHRAVIREQAESTKLRVVYEASVREHDNAPSLNECLYTGPPLQNQLWSVIVRNRFHPVAIAGDLGKAFLLATRSGGRSGCLTVPLDPGHTIHWRRSSLSFYKSGVWIGPVTVPAEWSHPATAREPLIPLSQYRGNT